MADEVRPIDANALKESLKKYKVKGYNHKYVQGMQDAIDGYFPRIIDDAPTIEAEPDNGWISVKDRLPPTGVPVLIYVYNIEEMTVVSLDHDGLGFSNADEWFNIKNIHHWRPLPEPPKGE